MSAEQRKAVIKNADMSEQMQVSSSRSGGVRLVDLLAEVESFSQAISLSQQDAVDIASKALSEYNIEKVSRWWGGGMTPVCLFVS